VDACEPGDLPPTSAGKSFQGLAQPARCRDELLEIMEATSRALGVACEHCHEEDRAAPTHNKEIANWMATKFVPALRLRGGSTPTCADCHAEGGRARAKILGDPRRRDLSVEWMTTVLVERFETRTGEPLYCRGCHHAGLGDPSFANKVILTDRPFSPARDERPPDG
jgi:hypothetical protein